MSTEFENGQDALTDATRQKLKDLSKAFLRLHKILLDGARAEYEAQHGKISNPNQYLQLVLDDPHFSWLRKMSSIIALIDEAIAPRRSPLESDGQALLKEAGILLNFEDSDENFNSKLQTALQNNPDAVMGFNDTKNHLS